MYCGSLEFSCHALNVIGACMVARGGNFPFVIVTRHGNAE